MVQELSPVRDWLPPGKRAAVCFDVHPGKASQHYDGGGDLSAGALGHVEQLLQRHADLRVTLFVTADWREISPTPSPLLSRIPFVRERMFLSRVLPEGTRRIDRHPEFLAYLKGLPRTEIGLHGLHHIHPGKLLHVEFQDEPVNAQRAKLRRMLHIFDASGLPYVRGMCPPGWNAPDTLITAMNELGLEFVASSRDIKTSISPDAKAAMSGLRGAPLIHPARIEGTKLLQFTSNFQATSNWERAAAIIENGGLLAIKAHIVKDAMGYLALDGIDALYRNYLDLLFDKLSRVYGDSLWWTTMGEIARSVRAAQTEKAS
jgi:predicted deacetylase